MLASHGKGVTGILVLAICFLFCGMISAATMTGNISDKSDGVALYRVTVSLKSILTEKVTTGTVTDLDGNFKIKDIEPGYYDIVITSMGYASQTIENVQILADDSRAVTASLSPSMVDLDAVSVSASRRKEKVLEAPAAVSVLSAENIEARATLTPTEHLKGLPAVDVATTGLNQSNVVVRGFNNIFSGALLVLTDNRIARVPSLRFNAYNFIPTVNEDIERIEVVSGPGSALYGPNSASGVLHIITKSPFTEQGTRLSIGGGERELFLGSFRHSGLFSEKVGYKLSGQYYQGRDWKHTEPTEPDSVRLFRPTSSGPEYESTEKQSNARNFDVEKMSGEGRLDFLIGKNSSFILNGGFCRSSSIELTGLGAGQALDWVYTYGQARFNYKNLFVQGFLNSSNAGDTYLLETGQLIIDKSKLWAGQIQHFYKPAERLTLTYGIDMLLTRPETDGTINGRNEKDDDIDEYGLYLQSDLRLTNKLKFVAAARVDDNNRLEDQVFSPRAALVYSPKENHNFRATFNRAYSTPDNNNLYLDITKQNDMGGIGAMFEDTLGNNPGIDIRVQGVPESGFHWNINEHGPQFHSSFAYADTIRNLTPNDLINFNDPIFTNVMWQIGRTATLGGLQDSLVAAGLDAPTIGAIMGAVNAVAPQGVSGVNNTLMTLDPDIQAHVPTTLNDISDIDRLRPTITQTFELGYNGIIGNRLKFSVDAYRTKKNDFIGPLTVETPNVFLDPGTLQAYLYGEFTAANPDDNPYLAGLDTPAMGGNENGTVVDELTAMFTSGAASIPFGTVTPDEAHDPTALLVTYRNFGDISFYGADFAFAYHLNQSWNFGGTYSYITKNFFAKSDDQPHDINLNSPRHKFGFSLQYMYPKQKLTAQVRYRFVDAFDMDSPFYGSAVKAYNLVDFNLDLNFFYGTHLALTVQNLLDNRHIEFIGAPEIGRLAIMRISQTF